MEGGCRLSRRNMKRLVVRNAVAHNAISIRILLILMLSPPSSSSGGVRAILAGLRFFWRHMSACLK
jgi:hypothetical protein